MKTYVVGGAIRDRLLGLAVFDRDHVVVGATVDEMLAAGYLQVGRDFPVFLHPDTHEEYALARTERKVSAGYQGFVVRADPTVTLEEDLSRRDLTINAMAEDEEGHIIDPFGGRDDLVRRVMRHVGPAFVEDPVRILRIARFAARFVDFTIAPETLELMRQMVRDGEVDALVAERVWQECERGLKAGMPSRMCAVLADCGALSRIAPAIANAHPETGWSALDRAAARDLDTELRFAVWMVEAKLTRAELDELAVDWRVPAEHVQFARLALAESARLASLLHGNSLDAEGLLGLFERTDALRRPNRLHGLVQIVAALEDVPIKSVAFEELIDEGLEAIRALDSRTIAAAGEPSSIAVRLRAARLAALARLPVFGA